MCRLTQRGEAGRWRRSLHRHPQRLLQGRHQVARRGVQTQETRHLPGKLALIF